MRTKLASALLALAVAFPVLISCSMPGSQAEEPKNGETIGQKIDDATITTKIKTTYLFNGHLNPFRINIDTQDGIVTLQGVVRTDIQRDLAGEIAKNAKGVRSVRNELQVSEGAVDNADQIDRTFSQAVVDASTTASVKTALALTKGVKASDVNVTTRWGTVTLTGTVVSKAEKQLAEDVTRKTEGVKEVEDKLQVRG